MTNSTLNPKYSIINNYSKNSIPYIIRRNAYEDTNNDPSSDSCISSLSIKLNNEASKETIISQHSFFY